MKLSYSLVISSTLILLSTTSGVSSLRHPNHAAESTDARSLMETVKELLSGNVLENNKDKDILNLHKFAEWMDAFHDDNPRQLQETRSCGQEIGRTTASEIKQVLEIYVTEVIALGKSDSEASKARASLTSLVEYDFVAIKVCSACSMITEEMLGTQAFRNTDEHGFQTYCGLESYGYNAVRIGIGIGIGIGIVVCHIVDYMRTRIQLCETRRTPNRLVC
jgi:hypothetical protein